LGIGDWGLGPIPNPQSPIPNPQTKKFIFLINKQIILNINFLQYKILIIAKFIKIFKNILKTKKKYKTN